MLTKRFLVLIAIVVLVLSVPALAGTKEQLIQLQTQVQALQDQMARMQQSFDERMGVMRRLVEQSTDNMNRMTTAVETLQRSLQQQNVDSAGKVDQVSAQVQAVHDSMDELKVRVANLGKQLDEMRSAQQNLAAPPTAAAPAGAQAPPPDVLYNNALRDYNAGKYELAMQEFSEYLNFYSNTDLAGNAQFYVADIKYRQGNFQQAIADYDKVLEQYPGGNKAAAAQLKKGYALLELGRRDDGVRELNNLIARYPRSVEATQARDRLRQLGASGRRPSPRKTTPR
jgi:tol-pal system protein YbgF